MFDRIIDETNPHYTGPLPKPRGLLPVPPEVAEELSRAQADQAGADRSRPAIRTRGATGPRPTRGSRGTADTPPRAPAGPLLNLSDDYVKSTLDDWTLRYYYEGETVACRSTPDGIEVLAAGSEEVRRFYQETPPENRQGVTLRQP